MLTHSATAANVERTNFTPHFAKSSYHSTMTEDRFNALALLFVHWDIHIENEKILDKYTCKYSWSAWNSQLPTRSIRLGFGLSELVMKNHCSICKLEKQLLCDKIIALSVIPNLKNLWFYHSCSLCLFSYNEQIGNWYPHAPQIIFCSFCALFMVDQSMQNGCLARSEMAEAQTRRS